MSQALDVPAEPDGEHEVPLPERAGLVPDRDLGGAGGAQVRSTEHRPGGQPSQKIKKPPPLQRQMPKPKLTLS